MTMMTATRWAYRADDKTSGDVKFFTDLDDLEDNGLNELNLDPDENMCEDEDGHDTTVKDVWSDLISKQYSNEYSGDEETALGIELKRVYPDKNCELVWTFTNGAVDPDGSFLATLVDQDGDEVDSAGLAFNGNTDEFESDEPWRAVEDKLLSEHRLDCDRVDIIQL